MRGERIKLHKEDHLNLYSAKYYKSDEIKDELDGTCGTYKGNEKPYKILSGRSEKRVIWRSRRTGRYEDNTKMGINERERGLDLTG